jgi:hypothetical protein
MIDDNLNGNGTLGMQIMREIDPNQQEEMEQALRGAFWFVPTPHHDIYHERRPPSPIYISTPSTTYVPAETRNQSLNGVVRAILEESRASGMNDLSWLQDY